MNKIIPRKENIPFHLTMLIPSLPNTVTTQIGISPLVFTTCILLLFFLALLGTNNLQLPAPQDVSACNSDICISYPLLTRLSPEAPVYPYVTKDVMVLVVLSYLLFTKASQVSLLNMLLSCFGLLLLLLLLLLLVRNPNATT